jgi:hypothetical protein
MKAFGMCTHMALEQIYVLMLVGGILVAAPRVVAIIAEMTFSTITISLAQAAILTHILKIGF